MFLKSPLTDQTYRIVAEVEKSECGEVRLEVSPLACGVMCFVRYSLY